MLLIKISQKIIEKCVFVVCRVKIGLKSVAGFSAFFRVPPHENSLYVKKMVWFCVCVLVDVCVCCLPEKFINAYLLRESVLLKASKKQVWHFAVLWE